MKRDYRSMGKQKHKPSQILRKTDHGLWFYSAAYWLCPLGVTICLPDRSKSRRIFDSDHQLEPTEQHTPKQVSKAEAEARSAEIRNMAKELNEAERQFYNAQPVWRLREISIRRPDEVLEVVNEFLRMVPETSAEYCWPMRDPGNEICWQLHGWKHISYDDIAEFWRDDRLGIEPATNRAEALGETAEVQQLFSAAARRDPEALGIIWSQFPNAEDHREILESFFTSNERPGRIPHPSELAADLVGTIFRAPCSDEADLARKSLLKLISVSVARGSRKRKGAPEDANRGYNPATAPEDELLS